MSIQLRQEILDRSNVIVNFARWKIIVVSAMFVSGLGLTTISESKDIGPIIVVLIGYPYLYIDFFIFRSTLAMHTISLYLRKYTGADAVLIEEKKYEKHVNEFRKEGRFYSEIYMHIISSVVFASAGAIAALYQLGKYYDPIILFSVFVIFVDCAFFIFYRVERGRLVHFEEEGSSRHSDDNPLEHD